jgi:hypothetical protein
MTEPRGAGVGTLNAFKVFKVLTSPLESFAISGGCFIAFTDPGDGFCEDFFTLRASESSF